jgi:hypothetical protein
VLEGRREDPGAGHGVRSQKVLAACYASARSGRAVEVETAIPAGGRP